MSDQTLQSKIKEWFTNSWHINDLVMIISGAICVYAWSPIIGWALTLGFISNPNYNPEPLLPWYILAVPGFAFMYCLMRSMPRCGI